MAHSPVAMLAVLAVTASWLVSCGTAPELLPSCAPTATFHPVHSVRAATQHAWWADSHPMAPHSRGCDHH
jgi:hypothetical protein